VGQEFLKFHRLWGHEVGGTRDEARRGSKQVLNLIE
jgi:hypothetical protein